MWPLLEKLYRVTFWREKFCANEQPTPITPSPQRHYAPPFIQEKFRDEFRRYLQAVKTNLRRGNII